MKALRRVLYGIGALLLLVVLAVVGVVTWLHTGSGEAFMQKKVVALANQKLSGQLALGDLKFDGDTLLLRDVVLKDPDGEVVAKVAQVTVDLGPTALLSRTARVDHVRLVKPELFVVQDEDGTNLQRALEPKEKKPKEPKQDSQLPLNIVVGDVTLEDGHVEFQNTTSAEPLMVDVTGLDAQAAVTLLRKNGALDAWLKADATFNDPVDGPLALKATVKGNDDAKTIDLSLDAADAVARANVTVGEQTLHAVVSRLELPDELVRAFVPKWPLQVPLTGHAKVDKDGGKVSGTAELRAGSGRINADGEFNLDTLSSRGVTLDAEHLNLAQLSPGAPSSDIELHVRAHGGGHSLQSAKGALTVEAPKSKLDGSDFGPIHIAARAEGGTAFLEKFEVNLPGVAMSASGQASQEQVALSGRVDATDLGELARTLGKLAGPKGLPLDGKGALSFRAEGPLKGPAVTVSGDFPELHYAQNWLAGLKLNASVPNVRDPLAGDARVLASAKRIIAGGRTWEEPNVALTLDGSVLALNARTRGTATLVVSLLGTVDEGRQGLTLTALTLKYPEATWHLVKAAPLSFRKDALAVSDLALQSGPQKLALDGKLAGERLNATVDLQRFALNKLPRAFVPKDLKLGGEVSGHIVASGTTKEPDIDARVQAKDVQVKEYRDLNGEVAATWDGNRAKGKLEASALGLNAHGTFDVPVLALKAGTNERVSAKLRIDRAELQNVLKQAQQQLPLDGVLHAEVDLSGTARNPKLDAAVQVDGAKYRDLPVTDLSLTLKTGADGRPDARVTLKPEGTEEPSYVALEVPWSLGQLLREPPTAKKAMRAPLKVTMRLRDLPVPVPKGRAQIPLEGKGVGGSGGLEGFAMLKGDLDIRGTALSPRGGGTLTLSRLRLGDFMKVVAQLDLSLKPTENELALKVHQAERELVNARFALHDAIATLMKPNGFARAKVTLDADWGPISIGEVQQWMPVSRVPGEDPPPLLTGVASGSLRAEGTLMDPKVALDASVHGLGSAAAPTVGDVTVVYRYDDAKNELQANLLSGAEGLMTLVAKAPVDLSWQSLKSGLSWRRAPLTATFRAKGFDPSFLSGVSPKLRNIGGVMEAKVDAHGPLSLPQVNGRFEWKNGVLSLAGNGEYRDVHVLVEGNEQRVDVKEIAAKAGGGSAHLDAVVTREGEGVKFQAKGKLDQFPIVSEDQLAATVSLNSAAHGTATVEKIDIPELKIDEAHVVLPDKSRKDLQKLKPPENVSFVWNGKPLEGADKKKEKANAQGTGGAGAAGAQTREMVVRINAPRNLWVRGKDMNFEVGLGEGFRVNYTTEPQLFGDVLVHRGYFAVMGRRFDFKEDSKVTFTGPVMDPRLSVAAVYKNERENATVTLHVTGSAQNLELKPTSDPPMTETEIYTLIATGRRSLRPGTQSAGGGSAGGLATSVVGGLVASQLKEQLEAVLPLDVLEIHPGDKGVAGTRVEAGMYVTDRLYMGVQTELGARREDDENQNQLNVEYELWKHWMLELEYGDARKGNADLMWRKSY